MQSLSQNCKVNSLYGALAVKSEESGRLQAQVMYLEKKLAHVEQRLANIDYLIDQVKNRAPYSKISTLAEMLYTIIERTGADVWGSISNQRARDDAQECVEKVKSAISELMSSAEEAEWVIDNQYDYED